MGLSQALIIGGRRPARHAVQPVVVSANIANAETPGYVKKIATPVAAAAGNVRIGVRLSVDQPRARPIRAAPVAHRDVGRRICVGSYPTMYQRLQAIYGAAWRGQCAGNGVQQFHLCDPGALATSPDSNAARYGVLSAGQALAQQLNGTDRRHPGAAQRRRTRPRPMRSLRRMKRCAGSQTSIGSSA